MYRYALFWAIIIAVFSNTASMLRRLFPRISTGHKVCRKIFAISQEDDVSSTLDSLRRDAGLDDYWIRELTKIERPSAVSLIPKLAKGSFGFEPAKKGTFLDFILQQKWLHPHKVILARCGDFYETYGLDAIMLVNYAGLNAMGNSVKAGCPIKNVQATLDYLTSAGLTVAVYEEHSDVNADKGPSSTKPKLKERFLSQIVSPASSQYRHELCLRSDDIEYRQNRPAVGIMETGNGYTLMQVWMDEKVVEISERLTAEGLMILVRQDGFIEPIYQQMETKIGYLDSFSTESVRDFTSDAFKSHILRKIVRENNMAIEDFREKIKVYANRPRSLYTSTAEQIGVIHNSNIPNLVKSLLPPGSRAHSNRFLQKWITVPPPYDMANHMHSLCRALMELPQSIALPQCSPVPVGKIISLLKANQCNVALFRDIRANVLGVAAMISKAEQDPTHEFNTISPHMLALCGFEVGRPVNLQQLHQGCIKVAEAIDSVIADPSVLDPINTDPHGRIPDEFFSRNEQEMRGKVSAHIPAVTELYCRLEAAALALSDTVNSEFPSKLEVHHCILNNAVMLKSKPKQEVDAPASSGVKLITPIDRNGKPLPKRFTTANVAVRNQYVPAWFQWKLLWS